MTLVAVALVVVVTFAMSLAVTLAVTTTLTMSASMTVPGGACMLDMMAIRMPGRSVMSTAIMVTMARGLCSVDDPIAALVIATLDPVSVPIESERQVVVASHRGDERDYVEMVVDDGAVAVESHVGTIRSTHCA
jgi:hypothetical protein